MLSQDAQVLGEETGNVREQYTSWGLQCGRVDAANQQVEVGAVLDEGRSREERWRIRVAYTTDKGSTQEGVHADRA